MHPSTGLPRGGSVGALVGLLSVAAHGAAGGGYPDSPEFALLLTISVAAGCAATGFARNGAPCRTSAARTPDRRRPGDRHRFGSGARRVVRRGKSPGGSGFWRPEDAARHRDSVDRDSRHRSEHGNGRRRERLLAAGQLAAHGSGRGAGRLLAALAAGQLGGHAVLAGLLGHTHGERASHIARGDAPVAGFLPTGWMLGAHVLATVVCAVLIMAAERLYGIITRAVRAALNAPRNVPVARVSRWTDPSTPTYRFPPQGPIGPRAPPALA